MPKWAAFCQSNEGLTKVKVKTKHIEVLPYNPEWPFLFEAEAEKIREVLGDNCVELHHIGSTSIPGLSAKPIIDMIAGVKDLSKVIPGLESLGFKSKGEYNIPMRLYFSRNLGVPINLHVYGVGHPEIELNLSFRNYVRAHNDVRDAYAALKADLLMEKSSFEVKNSVFTGYNLGKDAFIRDVLKKAGFNRLRMMKCVHHAEWAAVKHFRDTYFFGPHGIEDPYTRTFNHENHGHLVLYQGVDIIGYAHIQFWPDSRAALRIIVVDERHRHNHKGSQFLMLIEKWLCACGIRTLHTESSPAAYKFYVKNGYTPMSFNDPDGYEGDPQDIPLGKRL